MSMFKTIGSGTGSCKQVAEYLVAGELGSESHDISLQRYLAGDESASRALEFGSSPDIRGDQLGWAAIMQSTRERWGKDAPPPALVRKYGEEAQKHWRTYYHWTISPAPSDHASAKEVGDLARDWLEAEWPARDGWQWIYSVHADNAGGIMHAHIVMNAVNSKTGRKAHIDNDGSDALADRVQKLAADRGMGVLPLLSERRKRIRAGEIDPLSTAQDVRMTPSEIAMRARGVRSWVADIRDEIDGLVPECRSYAELVSRMEADGYSVEHSRRGLGFRHPDSTGSDKKILAIKLGLSYTESGLSTRIGSDFDSVLAGDGEGKGTVDSPGHKAHRRLRDLDVREWIELQFRIGPRRSLSDIDAVIDAIAVIRQEGLSTSADLIERLDSLSGRVSALERDSDEIAAASREAAYALEAARRMDATREEISRLPKGPWDKTSRIRRNELVKQMVDDQAAVDRVIDRARVFLGSSGLLDAPDADKVEGVLHRLRERSASLGSQVSEEREKLDTIVSARSCLDVLQGRRVRPVRSRSGIDYTPVVPVAPSRRSAGAEMRERSAERQRDDLKSIRRLLAARPVKRDLESESRAIRPTGARPFKDIRPLAQTKR